MNRRDVRFLVLYRDPTKRVKTKRGWRDKRVPFWFKERADAEAKQKELNAALLSEGASGMAFDAVLRADAIGARRKLDASGHQNVSLVRLAEEYCTKVTKAGASAEEIGQAIKAFTDEKEFVDGRSLKTLENLGARVWQWVKREHIATVGEITTDAIERLRKRPGVSARTRINDMAAISSFCTFLFDEKKLPFHPVRGLKRPHAPTGPKATFTADECGKLLKAAGEYRKGKFLGTVAALLFTGARPSELEQTVFSYGRTPMVRLEGGKLRGRANRVVPLNPAAVAWLRAAGKPSQVTDLSKRARANLCELAGVKWIEDICRHTYISNRAAIVKNDAAVAREAGTSEATIYRHYHKPMSEADARKWAALRPAKKLTPPTPVVSLAA